MRSGGVVGVDWLMGLPRTAKSKDQVQVYVEYFFGEVHAVPLICMLLEIRRRVG